MHAGQTPPDVAPLQLVLLGLSRLCDAWAQGALFRQPAIQLERCLAVLWQYLLKTLSVVAMHIKRDCV